MRREKNAEEHEDELLMAKIEGADSGWPQVVWMILIILALVVAVGIGAVFSSVSVTPAPLSLF